MATFEYLRISLARIDPPPLLDRMRTKPALSRQEFLREAFSEKWNFSYRRKMYAYVPIPQVKGSNIVGGLIGRQLREFHYDGPESDWRIIEQKHWSVSFAGIDISEDVQIAAVQYNPHIGDPRKMMQALLDTISKKRPYDDWHAFVEYVSSEEDFWNAAKRYAGKISSLNFVFVPPNMLRAQAAVNNLVKAAAEEANSEITELKLKNPKHALRAKGDLVAAAVSTATKGAGKVIMKSGKTTVFSSSRNRKTKKIEKDDMPMPSAVESIRKLFKWLLP